VGLDLERLREDTPACARLTHLNNAGASLPPRPVTEAVVGQLRLEESIGGYEAAEARQDRVERCYDALARLVGSDRREIAMTESATQAWNTAFHSLPWAPGDRVLTGRSEYVSNAIALLQAARRYGVQVDLVPDDSSGRLSVEALEAMLDPRVKLIAVTHVPSQGGQVNPVVEIGAVARRAEVPYLLDACQSVGQLPLDVREIGCDLLTASGRKFLRGPRGTGFLYCSSRLLERLEPVFLGVGGAAWTGPDSYRVRGDARRFESWEHSCAGRIGLGVAAEYALEVGLPAIRRRVVWLADLLRQRLRALPGVSVHDRGAPPCAIVAFSVRGRDSAEVARALRAERINVSLAGAQAARWHAAPREQASAVRASVHYYNTVADLDRLCAVLPVCAAPSSSRASR
jgi:cysteine desulfurase / selenocysteine lyase